MGDDIRLDYSSRDAARPTASLRGDTGTTSEVHRRERRRGVLGVDGSQDRWVREYPHKTARLVGTSTQLSHVRGSFGAWEDRDALVRHSRMHQSSSLTSGDAVGQHERLCREGSALSVRSDTLQARPRVHSGEHKDCPRSARVPCLSHNPEPCVPEETKGSTT